MRRKHLQAPETQLSPASSQHLPRQKGRSHRYLSPQGTEGDYFLSLKDSSNQDRLHILMYALGHQHPCLRRAGTCRGYTVYTLYEKHFRLAISPTCMNAKPLRRVQLFALPRTVPCKAPLFHGISQARIQERVAISISRGSC